MDTTVRMVEITSASGCVGHRGDEAWAVRVICEQSHLDVDASEASILVHRKDAGHCYVYAGGCIIGSYFVLAPGVLSTRPE